LQLNVYKIAASAAQFSNCILLQVYPRIAAVSSWGDTTETL